MSKTDLTWTKEHAAIAAGEGWRLADTVDEGTDIAYYMVATAKSTKVRGFETDQIAQNFVVQRAQAGGAIHQRALGAAMQSQMNRKKK